MRVLLITSSYPSDKKDPRGIFVHRLAVRLSRRGTEVLVLAPGAPGVPAEQVIDGVRVIRVRYWIPRWQTLAVGLAGIMPNLKTRPWLVFQALALTAALVWASCRASKHRDLINAHWLYLSGIAGAMAGRFRRIPLVVTSQGGDLNLTGQSRFLRAIARAVAKSADSCVGVSRALCCRFMDLGVPAERVSLISSIGVERTGPSEAKRDISPLFPLFANSSGFKILYLGSLIPRKSVHTLVEAHHVLLRRGLSPTTAIVGAGPEESSLKKLVAERSLTGIHLIGQQSPGVIAEWLAQADVLVLPSLSEGRPNVVLEAMANGVPVVASDVPGTREIVENERTGLLFRPGDAENLAECLDKLNSQAPVDTRYGESCPAVRHRTGSYARADY